MKQQQAKSIHEIEPGRWAFYCKYCGKKQTRRVFAHQSEAIGEWKTHRETDGHLARVALMNSPAYLERKRQVDAGVEWLRAIVHRP